MHSMPQAAAASLTAAFDAIPDPRRHASIRYPLPAMLALAVSAILAGQHSVLAIAEWGARQPAELLARLGFAAGLDMLAHTWGPESAVCRSETAMIEQALHREFLEALAERAENIAVIVTADHGQATVLESSALPLRRLVADTGGWSRQPTGERRSVGIGFSSAVQRDEVLRMIGSTGVLLNLEAAIEQGLYGSAPQHPELRERIGEALLLARGGASYPFRPSKEGAEPSRGGHGSLTPEEMYVPLMVWRF